MKKFSIFLITFLSVCTTLCAKITLPEIISDNMVLQQDTEIKLWGKATPNSAVTVTPSWNNRKYQTQADTNGNWLVKVQTPAATFSPQTITVSDDESVTLGNILIGEVWFASGQSNMEMPLNGFRNNPILNSNETIALSGENKGIRFATVSKTASYEPRETVEGTWKESNPENSPWFSATAYHFAVTLSRSLNVPVGIIVCAWGGSRVESWISREILTTYPDIDLSEKAIEATDSWRRPLVMYNGMVKPLTNYTIKGFFWYQGESNVGQHHNYAQRLADMVGLWRADWGLDELPFYYADIAPWMYNDGEEGISAALLREAQFKAQSLIPNSRMITTGVKFCLKEKDF